MRFSRVSGRLAIWIQTTKSRRWVGASRLRKKCHAFGLALSAFAMYAGRSGIVGLGAYHYRSARR